MKTASEILARVTAERLSLADFLDELEEHEWAQRSLCAEWTVHEVAAHLTVCTQQTVLKVLKGAIKARGDFDRMESDTARELAAQYGPTELIAQFRETAGSARRTPLSSPLDPLVDVLVHGQDIARPLGRVREIPADLLPVALDHFWNSKFYGTRKRFHGLRLIASDLDWVAGDGPAEVHGPAADLLLLASGRPAGLHTLTGPGLPQARTTLGL